MIDDIVKSDYEPTFDNTIVKFENAFDTIEGVVTIYYHYFSYLKQELYDYYFHIYIDNSYFCIKITDQWYCKK